VGSVSSWRLLYCACCDELPRRLGRLKIPEELRARRPRNLPSADLELWILAAVVVDALAGAQPSFVRGTMRRRMMTAKPSSSWGHG
jgi:hypothetical protein